MQRTLYLIFYDISEPRRLRKIHKLINAYAIGGQKSLYECWLTPNDLLKLKQNLVEQMEPLTDRVQIVQLDTQSKPIFMGLASRQSIKPFLVV